MSGSRARSLSRNVEGSTAMEFGLVSSALMLLMAGGLELSVLLWQVVTLQSVAAEAARCGAISAAGCTTTTTTATYAVSLAKSWLGSSLISSTNVTVTTPTQCGQGSAAGTFEQVSISAPTWTSLFLYPVVKHTLTLTACYPV
jgi:Flp pilus assembly protein TadG